MLSTPLFTTPHGFTTRGGGVSLAPYDSLNLSAATGDNPEHVQENQQRVLNTFGNPPMAFLHQVHGNVLHSVEAPGEYLGDGLLTQQAGLLLRVGIADCYPVLLYDPVTQMIGALHAGWRGVAAQILPLALSRMQQSGCDPANILVATGPGISSTHFEIGPQVADQLSQADIPVQVKAGRYTADLGAALKNQAYRQGIRPQHYWTAGACTYSNPQFFSHRRDQGKTGRMWALIMLSPNLRSFS
jgi:polyphenol oxidase